MITSIKNKIQEASSWFNNEVYNKFKNGVMATTFAIASVLSLSSCGDITKKDLYDSWLKTEQLKNSYNMTYDNIEKTKIKMNEYKDNIKIIEDSLKNTNLSEDERKRLEIEENTRQQKIRDLDSRKISLEETLKYYYEKHNDAVEDYYLNMAKYEENKEIINTSNSVSNHINGKLESVEKPGE